MVSSEMQTAINQQINLELTSAYAYLAAAAHFEAVNLPGSAAWMRNQASEELTHALKLFDHLHDRSGRVRLQAIGEPTGEFATSLAAFEMALHHEQKVTAAIHQLYALASKENDYATQVMLQWFIREQVEEEKSVTAIVERLKLAGDSSAALLMIDKELGERTPEAEDAD